MRTNGKKPGNQHGAYSKSQQVGTRTGIKMPISTYQIKYCSQKQILSKQQALRQALQSEETLEAEREEMLSVVTNLKDRHRLEAIFEEERRAASYRLLALSYPLSNSASSTSKPGEES